MIEIKILDKNAVDKMTIEEAKKLGATHYFEWWDGMRFFKRTCKGWKWLINGSWMDTELLKIYWIFGWKCKTKYLGGPIHKLKPL